MDIEKVIRDYISGVIHLSLGTCTHNRPWVCEVHYAYDDSLNFYFLTRTNARHSKDIATNSQVAGNIVMQHKIDDAVRGVYFDGVAELLEDVDSAHVAYLSYKQRFGIDENSIIEAQTADGHKFYKITVKEFSLFDGKESIPSQKYTIPWII